jgi:hypothetical protein
MSNHPLYLTAESRAVCSCASRVWCVCISTDDLLWLIPREHAHTMLNMYDDFATPYPYLRCGLSGRPGKLVTELLDSPRHRGSPSDVLPRSWWSSAELVLDVLVSANTEQWRARVGKLHRLPYRESTADALPTTVARFTPSGGLCFVPLYAEKCVPLDAAALVSNQSCPPNGWASATPPWRRDGVASIENATASGPSAKVAAQVQDGKAVETIMRDNTVPAAARQARVDTLSIPAPPTRGQVLHELLEASTLRSGVLVRHRTHIGLAGHGGEVGRSSVQAEYVDALKRSKIVVTCSPDLWCAKVIKLSPSFSQPPATREGVVPASRPTLAAFVHALILQGGRLAPRRGLGKRRSGLL